MGFSLAGLAVSVLILAPNALLLIFRPVDTLPQVRSPWVTTWLERGGQALCLVVPALTGQEPGPGWWLIAVMVCVVVYLGLWVRYLATGRRIASLYAPLGAIPIPMALFPIAAFVLAAAWLSSIETVIAALILAAGHLPIATAIARAIRAEQS